MRASAPVVGVECEARGEGEAPTTTTTTDSGTRQRRPAAGPTLNDWFLLAPVLMQAPSVAALDGLLATIDYKVRAVPGTLHAVVRAQLATLPVCRTRTAFEVTFSKRCARRLTCSPRWTSCVSWAVPDSLVWLTRSALQFKTPVAAIGSLAVCSRSRG
jgi:hypothetical protein